MGQIREAYPYYTQDQLSELKENEFVNWFKFYASFMTLLYIIFEYCKFCTCCMT